MKNALCLSMLLLGAAACAPTRPAPTRLADAPEADVLPAGRSDYYVDSRAGSSETDNEKPGRERSGRDGTGRERPGMSRLGQKRLLPDPIGGLGTTNDLTLKVTDIRLTGRYTVLYLTFGLDTRTASGYQPRNSNSISFNGDARLLAGTDVSHPKTFKFVRAEGIVLTPDSQTVDADEQVNFKLYFERLDRGLEDFSLFECEDTQTSTCWNVRGMHVTNPADSTVTPRK